ncbi:Citrate synthase OS=Tsukamurella paurometabola (strain ATCC 8368 / DSM / CCUG 35730 / CIP 100753/ JCM 10117 / KCTC 9821 / NBRC 16120 / NCIMB 702349 / NCTC 13040) OX=521096 GN=Tpau_1729 PE=3 SV=1 [Tsukamurella paurometabola]|uniref:Citrate synthase n=1 Tax=Tsukamurella paurometabola (strain ATCC 8368 / DSM 20162 / CCUG 35730 / CIP 100753 / JCM 10117 / KCTC 9821 / NBRC 16120 / NCIMB 702349 / NCTC 13040) TaxID=521096 RepID=D5UM67_TSUPD|nr:citrate/2-methylcitrate synthase [Tsukamurella paurometabola]ADG78347.1 Citrate (Si)-synthase [Tsukamurella paurometabola DSM 20162]SUP31297.1 Citrate synthase 1 [Tsukamurella paurometabola]
MTTAITAPRGLKNVVVADTELGDVRGEQGFFHYRDRDATVLARTRTFEDVWHLMMYGALPTTEESAEFSRRVGELRTIPGRIVDLLRATVTDGTDPLRALRVAISAVGLADLPLLDLQEEDRRDAALRYAAVFPTILAAAHRLASGTDVLEPDPSAGHAADYLRMATGGCAARDVAAVQTYLVATIDHGFNASTFAGRVIASAGSDMASCILGAVGAFLGPLHGGAPSRALASLDAIGDPSNTRAWVRERVANGDVIMGFGHAVYRTHDPRSELLKQVALSYDSALVRRATAVEREIEAAINELKPGRWLYANVEYYAGVVMSEAGLPPTMFTPTFAVARAVGWTANVLEQARDGKIIRPSARYTGPQPIPGV